MKVSEVKNWEEYSLDCPQGKWTGSLEFKAWADRSLVLYFSEVGTARKFRFSVFWNRQYKADDGSGPSFKQEVEAGDQVELTTGKTKTGYTKLLSARLVTPSA